jgi:hypothetical protein
VTSLVVAKLLVKAHPEGSCCEDNEGYTPYDLAVHWRHSKKIKRLLLKYDRYQDLEMWRRLEYGYLYSFCCCSTKKRGAGASDEGEVDSEREISDNRVKG